MLQIQIEVDHRQHKVFHIFLTGSSPRTQVDHRQHTFFLHPKMLFTWILKSDTSEPRFESTFFAKSLVLAVKKPFSRFTLKLAKAVNQLVVVTIFHKKVFLKPKMSTLQEESVSTFLSKEFKSFCKLEISIFQPNDITFLCYFSLRFRLKCPKYRLRQITRNINSFYIFLAGKFPWTHANFFRDLKAAKLPKPAKGGKVILQNAN